MIPRADAAGRADAKLLCEAHAYRAAEIHVRNGKIFALITDDQPPRGRPCQPRPGLSDKSTNRRGNDGDSPIGGPKRDQRTHTRAVQHRPDILRRRPEAAAPQR